MERKVNYCYCLTCSFFYLLFVLKIVEDREKFSGENSVKKLNCEKEKSEKVKKWKSEKVKSEKVKKWKSEKVKKWNSEIVK
jgi:hypothetical protein